MRYKTCIIWWNDAQKMWMIQQGYDILSSAKTVGAAKTKITKQFAN